MRKTPSYAADARISGAKSVGKITTKYQVAIGNAQCQHRNSLNPCRTLLHVELLGQSLKMLRWHE